jgi:DNA repair protein RecO (recombination protein O)
MPSPPQKSSKGPLGRMGAGQVEREQTEAIVLKGVDFSETSRIVTLLTPTRGRMACMAKGVKRPKSRMSGSLDTFNRVEIVYTWKDTRAVQTLIESGTVEAYTGIKGDLDKSAYGSFLLELALIIVHDNEPSDEFYARLVAALNQLDVWSGEVAVFGAWAALRLLTAAGFAPVLSECSDCGESVSSNPGFRFTSGVVCAGCSADRRVTLGEVKTLRALAEQTESCPTMRNGRPVFALLSAFASRQLESKFRSVGVIHQLERESLG